MILGTAEGALGAQRAAHLRGGSEPIPGTSTRIMDFEDFEGFHEIEQADHRGYVAPCWRKEFPPTEAHVSEMFRKSNFLVFAFFSIFVLLQ